MATKALSGLAQAGTGDARDSAAPSGAVLPRGGMAQSPAGAQAPAAGDWAICCSGGGIRSAAYCLGALQSLDQGGLLS